MVKKSRRFLVLVLIVALMGISITSYVASISQSHSSVIYGHGGDEVIVSGYSGGQTVLDGVIANMLTRVAALPTASVVTPVAPVIPVAPIVDNTVTTFDFLVRVDSGYGLSDMDACPVGYDWVAHIHGRITSGVAMDSFEPGLTRSTNYGWFALCRKSSNRADKDILSVISQNQCSPSEIDRTSCPDGYTQLSSFYRVASQCEYDEPKLAAIDGKTVNGGTLLVCGKNVADYTISSTSSCGSMQTLGHVFGYGDGPALYAFCKTSDGSAAPAQVPEPVIDENLDVYNFDPDECKYRSRGAKYYNDIMARNYLCP